MSAVQWLAVAASLVAVLTRTLSRHPARAASLDRLRGHPAVEWLGWAGLAILLWLSFAGQEPESVTVADFDGDVCVVALDVSRSMSARDVAPSRLARARAQLSSLLDRLPRELRIGLVLFAGEARLVCPPTADRAVVRHWLTRADRGTVETGGSDLSKALSVAAAEVRKHASPGRRSCVVLLSDGEHLAENAALEAAVAELNKTSTWVNAVSYGLGAAALIVDEEGATGTSSLPPIHSRADPDLMRRVAEATSGAFVTSGKADRALMNWLGGSERSSTRDQDSKVVLTAVSWLLWIVVMWMRNGP